MKICIGIDAAKSVHWAVAIDEAGRIVLDRAVKNNPDAINALIADLHALDGDVVIGIDVVGSFARFIEASLLAEGFALVHTPGIAVNRAGQGFAGGERKSDPRDAHTIAELVRTRDLRPVLADDDTRVALRLKVGRRRDLMQDHVCRIARIRGLLCGIHPGLEQAFDLCCKGPLTLLTRYVTPTEIRRAGKARIAAHLRKTPHLHGCEALAARAVEIAKAQRITVPGEVPTAELIRELAGEALDARQKISAIERDLEGLLASHPDDALIRSLPGMGAILTAEFPRCSWRHAALHLGRRTRLRRWPCTRPTPIREPFGLAARLWWGTRRSSASSTRVLSARSPQKIRFPKHSTTASDPKGKHHTQALIALARRRVTVLWTMLQRRETFDPKRKVA